MNNIPKLDLNDPKIAVIYGALTEVLGKHDPAKIKDYFTDDAVMIINEKKLQRHEIDKRIEWLNKQDNTTSITVKLHNAFFNGDQGFDYHTTEITHANGERSLYKIFGYIQLKDGKISLYEDVTIQLAGTEAMNAVTSTT